MNASSKKDLVAAVFSEMSKWGEPPDKNFEERVFNKYSSTSPLAVREAIVMATRLQAVVKESARSLYNEPYARVHEKVRLHIRKCLPGLSENAYSYAETRIMHMYLK